MPPNNLQSVSPAAVNAAVALSASGKYGTLLNATVPYNNDPGTWLIKNPAANRATTDGKWNNMVIIVHYTVA